MKAYSSNGRSDDCISEESEVITGGELMVSSKVVSVSGVGRISLVRTYGSLCGSGDMSIESLPNAGEEDGTGGVVTPSHRIGGVVAPSSQYISRCPSMHISFLNLTSNSWDWEQIRSK